jgi:tetratricopeptide (TPR) repeat protein
MTTPVAERNGFISFREADTAGYAEWIHEVLEGRIGEGRVYKFGDEQRTPGQRYPQEIMQAIADSDWVLVLIGPQWLTIPDRVTGEVRILEPHDIVRMEISTAISHGIPVVPLLLGGASMPHVSQLPSDLAVLPYYEAFTISDGRGGKEQLGEILESLTAGGRLELDRGRQLAAAGDVAAAELAYREAIASGNAVASFRGRLGLAYSLNDRGETGAADEIYKKLMTVYAARDEPDLAAYAKAQYAWALERRGEIKNAERLIREARDEVRKSAGLLREMDSHVELMKAAKKQRRKAKKDNVQLAATATVGVLTGLMKLLEMYESRKGKKDQA